MMKVGQGQFETRSQFEWNTDVGVLDRCSCADRKASVDELFEHESF
jgi:hypothetical protein